MIASQDQARRPDPCDHFSRRSTRLVNTAPEMVVEVWLVLYGCAKEGNMAAIKEFLDRTCGKAEDDELQERVEQLEALLEQHR